MKSHNNVLDGTGTTGCRPQAVEVLKIIVKEVVEYGKENYVR